MHTNHFMQAVKTLKLELCRAHPLLALQLHNFLTAWNRPSTCKFYDMVSITYNKHAQLKQYIHKHGYLGVVNRRGRAKARFVALVAVMKHFEAKFSHLFGQF